MKNGVHALFDCSFEMFPRNEYDIIGTKGKIEVPRAYRPDLHEGKGVIVIRTDDGEIKEEVISADQYVLEIEHFSDCIIRGRQPLYSENGIIQNARVIDACRISIETGKVIMLNHREKGGFS